MTPERLLIFVAMTATSLFGWIVMRQRLGLSVKSLGPAVVLVAEAIGTGVAFLVLNLMVGVGLLLTSRLLVGRFVPLYPLDDVAMIVLSFVQGLVFATWWRLRPSL